MSRDVIIGEIIGEAAMNKIGTKEERNISSPFPSARVSSRNNWRGKYLASRSTTDWHFNPVARVDKHVIPSTIFAGCSTSPPSPGQPLFLYFSELFGCLKSALMLLKFLAKQWLNDEPLPARGKRAEGTILTEIRRAPAPPPPPPVRRASNFTCTLLRNEDHRHMLHVRLFLEWNRSNVTTMRREILYSIITKNKFYSLKLF